MHLNQNEVLRLSYPDFVGFIGQNNTPPGGEATLARWIELAQICQESHLLDLACSTGFSSRIIARRTGCSGVGIDLSQKAIDAAHDEVEKDGLRGRVLFQVGDATAIPFSDDAFSHIVAGSSFGFISERSKALSECKRALKRGGNLCIGTFYYHRSPPNVLLESVREGVGFLPDRKWSRKWWHSFFGQELTLKQEEDYELRTLSDSDVTSTAWETIFKKSQALQDQTDEIRQTCFERFNKTRLVLNEHRKYQRLDISVWTKS